MTNFESMSKLHCIHAKEQKAEQFNNSIYHLSMSYLKHFIEYTLRLRYVVSPAGGKVRAKYGIEHSTGLKLAPMTQNEYCMLHFFSFQKSKLVARDSLVTGTSCSHFVY